MSDKSLLSEGGKKVEKQGIPPPLGPLTAKFEKKGGKGKKEKMNDHLRVLSFFSSVSRVER